MEEWYSKVLNLRDESEDSHETQLFTHRVFHELERMSIPVKDRDKFKRRMGVTFERWIASLKEDYSDDFITEIIGDDEFWKLTLKLTKGYAV